MLGEFAFALGPLAYSARSRADRRELGRLAELADLVLDAAALMARSGPRARAHLTDSDEVGVVGMLTALAKQRARGHIAPLLVADVAAMIYRAQRWVGATMAAESFGREACLGAHRASAQDVPANYEREAETLGEVLANGVRAARGNPSG